MTDVFKIPDGYQDNFRRLIPYMAAPLQNDPKVIESLLIYLKLGGDKLARVAVEAYNANQRQLDVEMMRQIREEVFYEEASESDDDEDSDDEDPDNEDESNNKQEASEE